MRLQVGAGLQHSLDDAKQHEILGTVMKPRLQNGDFAGAVNDGSVAILRAIRGEPFSGSGMTVAQRSAAPARVCISGPVYWVLAIIIAVILWIVERVLGIAWRRRYNNYYDDNQTFSSSSAVRRAAAAAHPTRGERHQNMKTRLKIGFAFASICLTGAVTPAPPPTPKPDLVVLEFTRLPDVNIQACAAGQQMYRFSVTVKNIGNAPSPSSEALGGKALVQVRDTANPDWANAASLNALAPGATQKIVIPILYYSATPEYMMQEHRFMAVVDPLFVVSESNESNNGSHDIMVVAPQACSHIPQ